MPTAKTQKTGRPRQDIRPVTAKTETVYHRQRAGIKTTTVSRRCRS